MNRRTVLAAALPIAVAGCSGIAGDDGSPETEFLDASGDIEVRIDDGAYDEHEGAAIEFAVGGEAVDPTDYELRDGDSLLVSVST